MTRLPWLLVLLAFPANGDDLRARHASAVARIVGAALVAWVLAEDAATLPRPDPPAPERP